MKTRIEFYLILAAFHFAAGIAFPICFAAENLHSGNSTFEGRIRASITQGNQAEDLLYAAGTNFLRVELTATNRPNPVNILDRASGELTLVFPNNNSFTRLKSLAHLEKATPATPPEMHGPTPPPMPQMPPGIGPQSTPGAASALSAPGIPMQMPPMAPVALEPLELRDMNEKTNILGYACEHFQIRQRGKTMEIWATDRLVSFQTYERTQPSAGGASTIEEHWGDLLKTKGLFPLLAIMKIENGAERFRFEVSNVAPQNVRDPNLFRPPAGYREILPLPYR